MRIEVTHRHMDVSEALRANAIETVSRHFENFTRVERVHVILDVQKSTHKCEVDVYAKNHIHIEAEAESDDMYKSIAQAVERAEKQLRKSRDKVIDHHGHRERLSDLDLASGI